MQRSLKSSLMLLVVVISVLFLTTGADCEMEDISIGGLGRYYGGGYYTTPVYYEPAPVYYYDSCYYGCGGGYYDTYYDGGGYWY